jgi:c(7)-type cytochrome triheme protein
MSETSSRHKLAERTPPAARRTRLTLALLFVACLGFALTLVMNSRASSHTPTIPTADAPEMNMAVTNVALTNFDPHAAPAQGGGDFSRFAHTNPNHSRLPCLLCHRREDNAPKPKLPGLQLRSFNVRFDHARHASGAARPRAGCVACHKPSRGGVALSIPAGLGAHNTCYACHTPRAQSSAGNDISSCSTCHQLGRHRRTPETAQAFRVNFSHARHGARQRLGCSDCHSIRAGLPQGRQVSAPQPLMHHAAPRAQSCMTCHNNRRAFGGDDFTDCKRCHTGNVWHF